MTNGKRSALCTVLKIPPPPAPLKKIVKKKYILIKKKKKSFTLKIYVRKIFSATLDHQFIPRFISQVNLDNFCTNIVAL